MEMRPKFDKLIGYLANLGVIGGLILVAYQINQSVEITRAQMLNDYFIADMQLEMKMMGENPNESLTKAIFNPGSITEEDLTVLDRYFNYGIVQLERLYAMQELGYMPNNDLQRRIDYLGWHLGNPIGRAWWEEYKKSARQEFVSRVEAALRKRPITENKKQLEAMNKAVHE